MELPDKTFQNKPQLWSWKINLLFLDAALAREAKSIIHRWKGDWFLQVDSSEFQGLANNLKAFAE